MSNQSILKQQALFAVSSSDPETIVVTTGEKVLFVEAESVLNFVMDYISDNLEQASSKDFLFGMETLIEYVEGKDEDFDSDFDSDFDDDDFVPDEDDFDTEDDDDFDTEDDDSGEEEEEAVLISQEDMQILEKELSHVVPNLRLSKDMDEDDLMDSDDDDVEIYPSVIQELVAELITNPSPYSEACVTVVRGIANQTAKLPDSGTMVNIPVVDFDTLSKFLVEAEYSDLNNLMQEEAVLEEGGDTTTLEYSYVVTIASILEEGMDLPSKKSALSVVSGIEKVVEDSLLQGEEEA